MLPKVKGLEKRVSIGIRVSLNDTDSEGMGRQWGAKEFVYFLSKINGLSTVESPIPLLSSTVPLPLKKIRFL